MDRYALIPESLVLDTRLKVDSLKLYCVVALEVFHTGECFLTNNELAEKLNMSVSKISRLVSNLEQFGYVETKMVSVESRRKVVRRKINLPSNEMWLNVENNGATKNTSKGEGEGFSDLICDTQTDKMSTLKNTSTQHGQNCVPYADLTRVSSLEPTQICVPYADLTSIRRFEEGSNPSHTYARIGSLFINKSLKHLNTKTLKHKNIKTKKQKIKKTCVHAHEGNTSLEKLLIQTHLERKTQHASLEEAQKRNPQNSPQEPPKIPPLELGQFTRDAVAEVKWTSSRGDTSAPADLGIVKSSKSPQAKKKEKLTQKQIWLQTALAYVEDCGLSEELKTALGEYFEMLSELPSRKPLVFVKAQLSLVCDSRLSESEKLQAVKLTLLRGWRSLDYAFNSPQGDNNRQTRNKPLDNFGHCSTSTNGMTPEQQRYHEEMCNLERLAREHPGEVFYSEDGNWCAGAGVGVTATREGIERMKREAAENGMLF